MTNAWLERWEKGNIGWHQPDGHSALQEYWRPNSGPALVPLCGKAVDMLRLAERGHAVTGVELSEIAAREFFLDNELDFVVSQGRFPEYSAAEADIRIIVADFFDFTEPGFAALFDRAALIALPEEQRGRYAAHLRKLMRPDAFHLLVSLDYDQEKVDGPPFAVSDAEVSSLFPALSRASQHEDIENGPPKFHAAGVESMVETVWVS